MKTCIVLLYILPVCAYAQSIALLDREFKNPITVTETLTRDQLSGRTFPIYTADLDVVIRLTEKLARSLVSGTQPLSGMELLPAGHSHIAVATQRTGAHTTYSVSLSTRSGDVGTFLQLVKRNQGNKRAVQELLLFLDYLKNNRHMVGSKSGAGS